MVNTEFKTANFSIREFWNEKEDGAMPQDIFDNIVMVMGYLQKIREKFGKPIITSCGWRALEHNKRVGGSPTSAHIWALAVDFSCSNKEENASLYRLIATMANNKELPIDQLIWEFGTEKSPQWLHYSPKKDKITAPRNMFMSAVKSGGKTSYPTMTIAEAMKKGL